MNKSIQLIRSDLQKFVPYSSARDEAKQGKIWLNANESPWDDQEEIPLNRYPQKQPLQLLEKLATLYNVSAEQMLLSRGSDEAIDLLIRLFCHAEKDAVMIFPPTFGMYATFAQLQAAKVFAVPLEKRADFKLDVMSVINAWTPAIKIIFICSPNNPTGNIIPREDIIYLCNYFRGKSIIVVDEAYVEYAQTESLSKNINDNDNLVILRTFSKAYGLAGIRCGLLLAQKELVDWIKTIMAPYPLSVLTAQAVNAILSEMQLKKMTERLQCIKNERQCLFEKLK